MRYLDFLRNFRTHFSGFASARPDAPYLCLALHEMPLSSGYSDRWAERLQHRINLELRGMLLLTTVVSRNSPEWAPVGQPLTATETRLAFLDHLIREEEAKVGEEQPQAAAVDHDRVTITLTRKQAGLLGTFMAHHVTTGTVAAMGLSPSDLGWEYSSDQQSPFGPANGNPGVLALRK